LKGDTRYLEKYLADDYVGVGGDGRVFTKTESIQRRKSGAVKVESIDELAVRIRVYGDTAIVNSLASLKGMIDGKAMTGDSRATFVWVKQKGNWKEVAFQITPIAPASK
jgi:ketosteroid isomerase-like protein